MKGVNTMVDPVRNTANMGSLAVHDNKKSNASSSQSNQTSESLTEKVDIAAVSVDLSLSEKVSSLASSPPVDMELVTEIRNKVEEGRYPIDLDAISAKLFESIQDGEG